MLFSIYAGLETELLEKNVGAKGLEHIWTYVPPSELDYPVNFGMNMKDFRTAARQASQAILLELLKNVFCRPLGDAGKPIPLHSRVCLQVQPGVRPVDDADDFRYHS